MTTRSTEAFSLKPETIYMLTDGNATAAERAADSNQSRRRKFTKSRKMDRKSCQKRHISTSFII